MLAVSMSSVPFTSESSVPSAPELSVPARSTPDVAARVFCYRCHFSYHGPTLTLNLSQAIQCHPQALHKSPMLCTIQCKINIVVPAKFRYIQIAKIHTC